MKVVKFRNLCIIAHVDHGKTTLVDHLLKQAGRFRENEAVADRVMDSMDLERERGITIAAKNTSIRLNDLKINLVDTPGHADFGGEVERILSMVDCCLLLVDASEGPLPQTRFVLQKALAKNFKPIVILNKVDRPECRDGIRVQEVVNSIFDLFVDLGADDDQAQFPMLYACAKAGWCCETWEQAEKLLNDASGASLQPLFDLITKHVPPPKVEEGAEFKVHIANISYSDYVGELAIGRVFSGEATKSDRLYRHGWDEKGNETKESFQISKLFSFEGLEQVEVEKLEAGDIGVIAGCPRFMIGDTLTKQENQQRFERMTIEAPTVAMGFSVNNSPFAGLDGKVLLSRTLHERLYKETKKNVAIRLEETETPDVFRVLGRGELQFAILIEQMRREGFEFMVGKPTVLWKEQNGQRLEPLERAVVDTPQEFASDVTSLFQERKGTLQQYENLESVNRVRLVFEIPTRGLLGVRSRFLAITRGEGLLNRELADYTPSRGQIFQRKTGALVSDRKGKATEYALKNLGDRGRFFIDPGVEVYEGMIIGENSKEDDLNVNIVREKKLTNVRASHGSALEHLNKSKTMSVEEALEWMEADEWLEITPKNLRLRKQVLACNMRSTKKEDRLEA